MDVRSIAGSFQLPIVGVGTLLCFGAVSTVLSLPPPRGDGFVRGLAVLGMYALGWTGFVLVAFGLSIPPADGVGVRFDPWQRRLFVVAGLLGVAGAASPLLFWPLVAATSLPLSIAGLGWMAILGLAVLSLGTGLCWRVIEVVRSRFAPVRS